MIGFIRKSLSPDRERGRGGGKKFFRPFKGFVGGPLPNRGGECCRIGGPQLSLQRSTGIRKASNRRLPLQEQRERIHEVEAKDRPGAIHGMQDASCGKRIPWGRVHIFFPPEGFEIRGTH